MARSSPPPPSNTPPPPPPPSAQLCVPPQVKKDVSKFIHSKAFKNGEESSKFESWLAFKALLSRIPECGRGQAELMVPTPVEERLKKEMLAGSKTAGKRREDPTCKSDASANFRALFMSLYNEVWTGDADTRQDVSEFLLNISDRAGKESVKELFESAAEEYHDGQRQIVFKVPQDPELMKSVEELVAKRRAKNQDWQLSGSSLKIGFHHRKVGDDDYYCGASAPAATAPRAPAAPRAPRAPKAPAATTWTPEAPAMAPAPVAAPTPPAPTASRWTSEEPAAAPAPKARSRKAAKETWTPEGPTAPPPPPPPTSAPPPPPASDAALTSAIIEQLKKL